MQDFGYKRKWLEFTLYYVRRFRTDQRKCSGDSNSLTIDRLLSAYVYKPVPVKIPIFTCTTILAECATLIAKKNVTPTPSVTESIRKKFSNEATSPTKNAAKFGLEILP
jgi:hypothetical protein